MVSRPIVAPSILSADFSRLGAEVRAIDAAGADWIHVDVMDGHYVPNFSFGPPVVSAIRRWTGKPFDVHLMMAPVDPFLTAFAEAGADRLTIHPDAGPHPHRSLQTIRTLGKQAGIALNPGTPVDAIAHVLDLIDLVLVMSVNPGFGGQTFIPEAFPKIAAVRSMIGKRPILIEVDGGVSSDNAGSLVRAGVDVLVAGSAVFAGGEAAYGENIRAIRAAGEKGMEQEPA